MCKRQKGLNENEIEIETFAWVEEGHRQEQSLGESTWHVGSTEVVVLQLGTKEKTAHALPNCNLTTTSSQFNSHFTYKPTFINYCHTFISFPMDFSSKRVSFYITNACTNS